MTLAQQLLVLLGLLMTADLGTTLVGLRLGHKETNETALVAMAKLGPVRGLVVHQVVWFSIFTALVLLWPDQWGAVAIGIALVALAVFNNIVALSVKGGA